MMAFINQDAAKLIFDSFDDKLTGDPSCAKLYGNNVNMESNAICFKVDTNLAVDSECTHEVFTLRLERNKIEN